MATTALAERYAANLHGVLSCYDRIIITGTLPGACYAGGMTSFLYSRGIRIFDYARFAEPLRDRVRQRAQEIAQANGAAIEHVDKSHSCASDPQSAAHGGCNGSYSTRETANHMRRQLAQRVLGAVGGDATRGLGGVLEGLRACTGGLSRLHSWVQLHLLFAPGQQRAHDGLRLFR